MNNVLKNVGLFIIGAGVGSTATWYILSAKHEALIQEELESIQRMKEKNGREPMDENGTLIENQYEGVKRRYNLKTNTAEIVGDEDLESQYGDLESQYGVYPVPYPIAEEEFSTERLEYDKLSLKYYTDDDVLCDEQEVPIDAPLDVIGQETKDYLDAVSGNNQEQYDFTVYVRNESTSCDYEITIIENSYANEVLGYITPKAVTQEPKSKKSKARKKEEDGDDE